MALTGHMWDVADRARGTNAFLTATHAWDVVDTLCSGMRARLPSWLAAALGDMCEFLDDNESVIAWALQSERYMASVHALQERVCNEVGGWQCEVAAGEVAAQAVVKSVQEL